MDASYSPSNGAGYPIIDGSGGRQKRVIGYAQEMQSLSAQPQGPPFPTYTCCGPYYYTYQPPGPMVQVQSWGLDPHHPNCPVRLQQQEVHNGQLLQQPPLTRSLMEPKRPSQEDLQPESQRNTGDGRAPPGDEDMPDAQTEDSVAKQKTSMAVQQGGSASPEKTTSHEQINSCSSRPPGDGREVLVQAVSQKKKPGSGVLKRVQNAAQSLIWGSSHGSDEQGVDLSNIDNSLNRDQYSGTWQKEKMLDRIAALEANLQERQEELNKTNEELNKTNEEMKRSEVEARSVLNSILKSHESEVAKLSAEVNKCQTNTSYYKANAEKLTEQLSILEQLNAKQVGGTGAHKDSHAIPPNLEKSATFVNQTALTCTKTFIAFLTERSAFESHQAVKSVPKEQSGRYRTYAVEAYICRVMFAGFENDSYVDSLDCTLSAAYLPANYERASYFLNDQDLERRYKQYLSEYDSLRKLGLQGIFEKLKDTSVDKKNANCSLSAFLQFCCRKLVSIMYGVSSFSTEFPRSGDYSERFLLQQLATNPIYCDKFLKPFVNLAIAVFQLHRLAFQFHPPARIFRYAQGTPFDHAYMQNAVPIDDDDDFVPKDFVVGLMLIPGFQVGATIIKCIVYLVPRSAIVTTQVTDDHDG